VKFDAEGCIRALQAALVIALKQIQEEYLLGSQRGMLTQKGRKDLQAEDLQLLAGFIACAVVGGPWAVLDEWGKGSLMDTDNPALGDYIASGLWNPLRSNSPGGLDAAVVGRRAGEYTNIFGETKTSSGAAAGVNLEELAREGKLPPSFLPQPPSHAMRTAARWMMTGRAETILHNALNAFPWGSFVIATKD